MSPPVLDLTQASRAFWLSSKNAWGIEEYADLTPPWPKARLRWRVPETVNVNGERWLQRGPLAWSADLWRISPERLRRVPWQRIERDADELAASLDRAVERGGTGFAKAQARRTSEALRAEPEGLDLLRLVGMFDAAEHVVLMDLRSFDPVVPGHATRGIVAFLIDRQGRVLPHSKSVYVAASKAMNATDVHQSGQALEVSVHPVLIALDALNSGRGRLIEGQLVLSASDVG